jgi:hypothetical protein
VRGSFLRLTLLSSVFVAALAFAPAALAAPMGERTDGAAPARAECAGPCPIVVFGKGNIQGTVEFRYHDGRPGDACTVVPGGEGCAIFVDEFSTGGVLRPTSPGSRGIECFGVTMPTCQIRAGEQGSVCAAFTAGPSDPIPPSACPPPYVQAYKKGDGKGVITGSAPGRAPRTCDAACPAGIWSNFLAGDVVTLTATATQGTFLGWQQCPAPSGATCTFTLQTTFPICAVFAVSGPPTDPACPQTTPSQPPQINRPPNTRITAGPSPTRATRSRRATFRFRSTEARSRFLCRLDSRQWFPCRSPKTYRNLRLGRHTFRVKAIDRTGKLDPTAAIRRWRIRA